MFLRLDSAGTFSQSGTSHDEGKFTITTTCYLTPAEMSTHAWPAAAFGVIYTVNNPKGKRE